MTDEIKTPIQYIDVDEEYAGQRLDNFLLARLKGVPKSVIRIAKEKLREGLFRNKSHLFEYSLKKYLEDH